MCTISGLRGIQNLCNLSIDKLLARWYNGSSARLGRGRAAEFVQNAEKPQPEG